MTMPPWAPKHPCSHPMCGRLLARGEDCPDHPRPVDTRESAAKRGYDRRHERWRKRVLHLHPVCCIQVKCTGAASTVADHIKPLSEGGTWELSNGQGACAPCHNWKTATESRRRRMGDGGADPLG